MNQEQFDNYVESLDLKSFEVDNKAAAGDVLAKICEIYHKIRPILEKVSNFFLFGKKLKAAIKAFMTSLDSICPQG